MLTQLDASALKLSLKAYQFLPKVLSSKSKEKKTTLDL
ncbi:hypothetical protein SAMN05428947_102275 [Mucilaginibacter sp. OK283]|jgi:hypothetical protein|nr:hypothetical protein SAMN05428947_102275 [Mucilaginibacter sp. OK283]